MRAWRPRPSDRTSEQTLAAATPWAAHGSAQTTLMTINAADRRAATLTTGASSLAAETPTRASASSRAQAALQTSDAAPVPSCVVEGAPPAADSEWHSLGPEMTPHLLRS